jgi:hypothetical protein
MFLRPSTPPVSSLLIPPEIMEPRGEGNGQPGFMVRAIGSLLGKTSEWGLDDEGHRNIGGSRRSKPSEPRKVDPLPKSSQDAKERGNLALASGHYDEAVCMYSIGIAHESQNHVLYSNRLVPVPYRRP